jgi:autoinducer 2-degrading protein
VENKPGMATFVYVTVKKENIVDFIKATRENAENSVKEPGNLRFDFYQLKDDPCKFVLIEAYEKDEQAAAHKNTKHYQKWKETVAPWMAEPRKGIGYTAL